MVQSNNPIPSLRPFLEAAVVASKGAGDILQQHAKSGFRVRHKDVTDLVTDADHAAEQSIIDDLGKQFPTHRFLAEERGGSQDSTSPFLWVIDPLDGTTNFAHRFPFYSVSIGLEYQGHCVLGVVFDPCRNELFTATQGGGAHLNGSPLRVSRIPSLNESLLVTGFAYNIRETTRNNLDYFSRFALKTQGLRRTGSAALDLSYVAAGRFDGFWEVQLCPWDMAAGSVILHEAGGVVSTFSGATLSIYNEELVASNGHIHDAMLAVLNE